MEFQSNNFIKQKEKIPYILGGFFKNGVFISVFLFKNKML